MKQSRELKQFIFSHYLADGLRIALGGLAPAVIFARMGNLQGGITFSLAALTVSLADGPGPMVHKRNGMLFCTLCMVITAILTGLVNPYPLLLTAEIFLLCFFFSMFNIYGTRAASVGTAALLIMVLNIDRPMHFKELMVHVAILFGGCAWYTLFSLSVSSIRPYRLAQQSLALSIREVAAYLRLKSRFYSMKTEMHSTYQKLIAQQITVHEHQDATRELLFKSRQLIKESTSTGRQLVLVFVDIVDLFEQSTATHYDYQAMHKSFDETNVLPEIAAIIEKLSEELENLAYHINNNEQPVPVYPFQPALEQLKITIDKIESEHSTNNLILKKILVNLRNIVNRVQQIYSYFSSDQLAVAQIRSEVDLPRFVSRQDYDVKLFADNFSLKSTVFRHSLRVAIVALLGYFASLLFPVGHHSYWILLTIVVILKPGFSLTKQRNYERVVGTIAGAAVGMAILYFVKDETARFIFLMVFMICTYTFQRLNYIVSVVFMTPYILILFSFLGMGNISIARERIVDTLLGSFIAFMASYLVFPSWEYPQLKRNIRALLIANYDYLFEVMTLLAGKPSDITHYKLVRKNVYLSAANMASSFQKMLAEPKSKQKNAKEVDKVVVLNHILSSYTANLIFHLQQNTHRPVAAAPIKQVRKALYGLANAIQLLKIDEEVFKEKEMPQPASALASIETGVESRLMDEQLGFINNLTGDILKIVEKIGE